MTDAPQPTTERPRRQQTAAPPQKAAQERPKPVSDTRAEADTRPELRAADGPPAPPQEVRRAEPSRELAERRERARRLDVMDGDYDYNLVVTVPKDPNYVYRWELDEPGVLERRYSAYWERVEEQAPYHAYTDGLRPVHYVLIRKWRDWHAEDQRPRAERDRSVMDQIRRGVAIESFGTHEDGRPAQYHENARGQAIEISISKGGPPQV